MKIIITLIIAPHLLFANNAALVKEGEKLYKNPAKMCMTCHSIDGSKKIGPSFKGLYGKTEKVKYGETVKEIKVDDAYLKESITDPMKGVTVGYAPAMPKQDLPEKEVNALIAYIKSLK